MVKDVFQRVNRKRWQEERLGERERDICMTERTALRTSGHDFGDGVQGKMCKEKHAACKGKLPLCSVQAVMKGL